MRCRLTSLGGAHRQFKLEKLEAGLQGTGNGNNGQGDVWRLSECGDICEFDLQDITMVNLIFSQQSDF